MEKASKLEHITITRSTVCGGERVESGAVLKVGEDLSPGEAHLLINMRKAVEGAAKPKPTKVAKTED